MSAETDEILNKVKQTQNLKDRENHFLKKSFRYLRNTEVKQIEAEVQQCERSLNAASWTGLSDEGRQNLGRRILSLKRQLREESPPTNLRGETRDALNKRRLELEHKIREGMPPHEVMRRNPVGAVDSHRAWEKKNKARVLEWKNIVRALNAENDERDIANVERLRPSLYAQGQNPTVMVDAQIPGFFSYGAVSQERWDETFGEQEPKGALGELGRRDQAVAGPDPGAEAILPEVETAQKRDPGRPRKEK